MKTKLLLLLLLFTSTAFATPTTPTSDFTDNNNGTVTHKTTGLTWMRCALGQTWTGSACTGTVKTYSYDQAMALTSSFAGYSDWRLPNIAELHTLVERENSSPAMNTTVFPNASSRWFWSSSPNAYSSNNAWLVNFYYGSATTTTSTTTTVFGSCAEDSVFLVLCLTSPPRSPRRPIPFS